MKNRNSKLALLALTLGFVGSGCSDLNVKIESELTASNFPKTAEEFVAASGPIYTQLAYNQAGVSYAVEYWRMQTLSTDEAIIPARDGNFDDGGQYRQLHQHNWTIDHTNGISVWQWGYSGINTANRIIKLFEASADSPARTTALAELRTMRALFHFYMMDLYGNVPIVTVFGDSKLPGTSKRADVYAFIEKELKESIPNLNATVGALTYGRVNKWMANALLAKLYLNAEVYAGTPKYAETVATCDALLTGAGSLYALDDNYQSIFAGDNGPQIKDIIFAVPYDGNVVPGNHFTRFGTHPELVAKYSIPFRPSIAMSTIKEFYAKFNLKGDVRNDTWLVGKQFNFDGTPILVNTTKKGLDATYAGTDGTAAIKWQLEFSPDLTLVIPAKLDVGNDDLAKAKGIRSVKFYPDKNSNASTRYQGNDFPVFRLADIYLMKAEAILRGATATTVAGELQTPVVLVNKLRKRAKTDLAVTLTLDELLDERARELSWEGWRRNDLIRFGKFEDAWGFKDNKETFRRLFPIPASERALNPGLTQNPGY
ncbi:RagB/SusD family nutrient uptake outer membrane protein [Larkinella rosea]|uniref:RagB/SusD family nutrient uptake outer membrane protein n=1 Tax=Larkinella rosea TaxID=2025312 RepID=A0A3P1C279_9BACT|nr:RagB/SusD family nutrient uptake outer membrane protein [Larkinella rosea]RRB07206.1 RagB/SusD family nutrient uptake outer membrane protein [Larkinella rosea]